MTLKTCQHSLHHSSGDCFPLTRHIMMSISAHQYWPAIVAASLRRNPKVDLQVKGDDHFSGSWPFLWCPLPYGKSSNYKYGKVLSKFSPASVYMSA